MQHTQGRTPALAFDTGGLMVPNVPDNMDRPGEAVARADVFLRAMAKGGYTALNIGAHELALGVDDLRRLAAAHHMPLLSANLTDKSGKPAFQRLLVKQAGPLKIGVFGLITAQPADVLNTVDKQQLRIEPPNPAATAAVRELRAQGCDVVVVLSQLSRTEVDALMTHVKGIDLVLGSSGMDMTNQLVSIGDGFFTDTYVKGKYAGVITIAARGKGRLYAADMKAAQNAQRADLAAQVQSLQTQLELAADPKAATKMSKEAREVLEHQVAALRARMQRVTMELEAGAQAPPNANTVTLEMAAMAQELPDDAEVLKWVDKLKLSYPHVPGH